MKDLDALIAETITWSHRYEEIGDIIGNTDHIDDDHEPINDIEDAYINARVHREINAETIVDILHPEPFPNHDDFWLGVPAEPRPSRSSDSKRAARVARAGASMKRHHVFDA